MNAEILEIFDLAKNIRKFTLQLDTPIIFVPGKYVSICFEEKSKFRRSYSVLSYDAFKKTLTLVVKLHGEFTKELFSKKIGDKLFVYGPYGKFTLKQNSKNIFIAGGIGIVPLYSMFKQSINVPYNITHMFYSCQYEDEMAFRHELSKLENVNLYFTKEGTKTRFTIHDILKIPNYKDFDYYICGPDKMMQEVSFELQRAGITNVHSESFNI